MNVPCMPLDFPIPSCSYSKYMYHEFQSLHFHHNLDFYTLISKKPSHYIHENVENSEGPIF
jgi:hypothetical protein